jgi:hypothetical protein
MALPKERINGFINPMPRPRLVKQQTPMVSNHNSRKFRQYNQRFVNEIAGFDNVVSRQSVSLWHYGD